jgi:hypothetical protein
MKRTLLVGMLAAVGLAACSNSGTPTTIPSSLPTTLPSGVPSSVASAVGQQVCDIRDQILAMVGQIGASSLPSPADLAAQLQELKSQLEDQASGLESQGATPLADQVRAAADAIGQLASAVTGSDPAALIAATTTVASALSQLPGCPSPSPSGSP